MATFSRLRRSSQRAPLITLIEIYQDAGRRVQASHRQSLSSTTGAGPAALGGRFEEATTYGERAFAVMRTMRAHDAAAAMRMAGVVARAYEKTSVAGD